MQTASVPPRHPPAAAGWDLCSGGLVFARARDVPMTLAVAPVQWNPSRPLTGIQRAKSITGPDKAQWLFGYSRRAETTASATLSGGGNSICRDPRIRVKESVEEL